jgi:hypothetical protein
MVKIARWLMESITFEVALCFAYGILVPFSPGIVIVLPGYPLRLPLIAHVPLWVPTIMLLMLMVAIRSVYQYLEGHQLRLFRALVGGMAAGIVCLRLGILWFALIALGGAIHIAIFLSIAGGIALTVDHRPHRGR